jgi:hypothetical protein
MARQFPRYHTKLASAHNTSSNFIPVESIILLHRVLHLWKVRHNHMRIVILSRHWRRSILLPAGFMNSAVYNDDIELVMLLQNFNTLKWIAIHKDAVGVIAWRDLAKLFRSHEQFRNANGGGNNGFVRSEAKEILEVCEIASISAVGRPGEAYVSR